MARNGQAQLIAEQDGELHTHLNALNLLHDSYNASTDTDLSEICPVCKSNKYLNKDLRFLVNPECYHKMCESCVDRIFSQGPAPCPIAGCAKTLRKQRFRRPKFEDLAIEREVDIRRRIDSIFNRRESDFETLLDYNNYLEEVETLTFNLLYNIDVASTEAKISAYLKQNSSDINKNKDLSNQESASPKAEFAAQKEQAKSRRDAARNEEDEERREREETRRETLNQMATSNEDPDKIVRQSQKVVLKKSTARRTAAEKARSQQQDASIKVDNGAASPPTFTFAGLKHAKTPEPEEIYDPFAGYVRKHRYYQPRETHENPWFEKGLKTDPKITAGGYDVREYCARAVVEAFAGLGVFVKDEVASRHESGSSAMGTMSAAIAAGGEGGGMDNDPL